MHALKADQPIYSIYAGEEDFADLLEMYVDDTTERIGGLEAAWSSGNWIELHRLTHSIKGSAACYGYGGATPIAKSLLEAIKPEDNIRDTAEVRRLLDELTDFCRRMSSDVPVA